MGLVQGIFTPTSRAKSSEPTENVYFEIPSGMIDKLLANPFTGDGTLHPDLHLIYVDEAWRYARGSYQEEGLPFIFEGKGIDMV